MQLCGHDRSMFEFTSPSGCKVSRGQVNVHLTHQYPFHALKGKDLVKAQIVLRA